MSGLRERLTLLKEQQARQGESLKEKVTEATTTLGEYLKDKLKDVTDSMKGPMHSMEGGIENIPLEAHATAFGESLPARSPVPPGTWGMTNATEIPEAWLHKNTGIEQNKTGVNVDAGRNNRAGQFPNGSPVGKLGLPTLINREITAETPSFKNNTTGDSQALTFETPRNHGSPMGLYLHGNGNHRLDERTKGAGTSPLDLGTNNEPQISSEFADERAQHSSMFSKSQSKSDSINASPYSNMRGSALTEHNAATNGTLKNGDAITVHKPPPLESLPKGHIYVKGNEAHAPTDRYRSSSGIGAATFMPSSIPRTSALRENPTSAHTRPHNEAAAGISNKNYNADTSYSYEHNDTHSKTWESAPPESDSNFFAEQTSQKGTLTRPGTYLTGDGFRTTMPMSSANIWPNMAAHANQNVAAKQRNEARAHKPYLSMGSESLLGHKSEVENRQPYQHYASKPNITFRGAFVPHTENNQPSGPYTSHVGQGSDRRLQSAFSPANWTTHPAERSFQKKQKAPAETAHRENLSTGALFNEGRVAPGELSRSHEPGGYVPLSNTTNFPKGNVLPTGDHMTNIGAKANALPRSTFNWRNAPTTAAENTFVTTPNERAVSMYQNNLQAATSEMKQHYAKMSDSRLLDVNHNLSAVLYSHRESMSTANYTTGIQDRASTPLSFHGSLNITSTKNNFANPQNRQAGEIPRESTITGAQHSPESILLPDKMVKSSMAKSNSKFPTVVISPYENHEKAALDINNTGLRGTTSAQPPITTVQNDTAASVYPERLSGDVSLRSVHKAGYTSPLSEIKSGPKASNTGLAVGRGMPQNAGEHSKLSPNFTTAALFASSPRQTTSSDVQPAFEKSSSGAREPPKKLLVEAKTYPTNMPTDISSSIMKPASESTLQRNGEVTSNKDNSIMPSKLLSPKGPLQHKQYSTANASAASKHVSEYENIPSKYRSMTVKGEKSGVTSTLPVTQSSREPGEFHINLNLTNAEQKDQGQPINGALPSKVSLSAAQDAAHKLRPVLTSRTSITATGNKPPGKGSKVSVALEAPRSLLKTTKPPTSQVLPSEKSYSKDDGIQYALHEPPTPKAAHPNPGHSFLRGNVSENGERGPSALDYFEPKNTPIRTVLTTKNSEYSNLNGEFASGDQASRTKAESRIQAKPAAGLPKHSLQPNPAATHEVSEVYTKRGNQVEALFPSESSTLQNNTSVFGLSRATAKSAPTIINVSDANKNAGKPSTKKTVLPQNGLVQPETRVALTLPEEGTEGKNVAVSIEQHSPHLALKTSSAVAAAQKTTSIPATNNTSRNLENLSDVSGTATQSPKQRFNEYVKTKLPQLLPELHKNAINVVAEIQPSSLTISQRTSASVAPASRSAKTSASPPVSALATSENLNATTEPVTQLPGEQAAKISIQTPQPSFGVHNAMPEVLIEVPDVAGKIQEHPQKIPEMTLLPKTADLKGTSESATLPSPHRAQDIRASATTIARLPKKPPALLAEEVSQPRTGFEQTSPETIDKRTYVVTEREPPAASVSERAGASLQTEFPITTESTMHQFSPMFEELNAPFDRAEISKSPSALHSLFLIYGNTLVSPVSLPVLIESDMNTFPKRPYEFLCEIRPGARDYYSSTLIDMILASRTCAVRPKWYPTTSEQFLSREIENKHDSIKMQMTSLAIQEARRGMRGLHLPLNALAVYDYLTPRRWIAAGRTQSDSHPAGKIYQDSRYAHPPNIRGMTLLLPRIHVNPPKWHPMPFPHVIGEEVANGKELWKAWNFLPTIKPGVRHFVSPISTYSQIASSVLPRGTDASWMPGTSSFSREPNLDSRYVPFSDILARKLVVPHRYATLSPRYPKRAERLVLPEVMNGHSILAELQFLPFITKR